ncbi:MAG TPA: PDZ domain-containing protein [Acidimicrobiales bacterium]|nr:PDZ domain-containing protein [Acidimicrobiales bacterium]
MGVNGGYFRHPTIAGDTICFVSEDDLWAVPAEGGVARRLTANLAEVQFPALSPDGATIAFSSREEHHTEVWVMDAAGGPARRRTWFGSTTWVRGWTPDGRVLAVSDVGQPFVGDVHAYAVDAAGARRPEPLNLGPARTLSWQPGGPGVLLGRNTGDPARWKRYRGGTAGQLWVDARGTGTFKRVLPDLFGNVGSPMWIRDRIYFLCDHEGIANLYSVKPNGRDIRRHTDHDEYYARFAMTDGGRVVYQHAAEIWLFDPVTDETCRVDIDVASPRVQRNRRFVAPERFMSGLDVHPDGRAIVVETRGKPFSFGLWEGAVHQHGQLDGVRYRLTKWTPDGERLVTISDETGEDALEVHDASNSGAGRRLDGLDLGVVTDLAPSPKADVVAIANQRNELLLVDLSGGDVRRLDHNEYAQINGITWSPDGKWLAYSAPVDSERTRSLKLCDPTTGVVHTLTPPTFWDFAPSFDPDGKYLYFLSLRVFDPVYDSFFFELGFPRAVKPYLVTLRRDIPSPFLPEPRGFGEPKKKDGEKSDGDKSDAEPTFDVDLDSIERRVVEFPLPVGVYTDITGLPGGKVVLLSGDIEGTAGTSWSSAGDGPKRRIEMYDLNELHHDVLVSGVSSYAVSGDRSTLVYDADRRLRAIKAGEKPPEDDAGDAPGRRSGWIDLGRIRVSVDPPSEWRQMLLEAWRLQREHFWVADMSGVDWRRVRDRYLPLIDKVGSRFEFSDLIWEMQGELGTSHAYELGGDYRPAPNYALGFLGADLDLDEKGRWVVRHIVRGDHWHPTADSPLDDPGVAVEEGEIIVAVNGRPVGRDLAPEHLLVHQAGALVELTISDGKGRKPRTRTVTVKALTDERPARYREWVERNRAIVRERTAGRVGYVHVPDMGAGGYAEFHRSYFSEVARDALVIDVRSNGGGHVSQKLLEKLARRRIGYDVQRWGAPEPYPTDSPAGPLVCITDEQAGSDGDIFTHCFKLMGLGPVVGKRTWGGVIGINPQHMLVDGSMTTQPEYSFWFVDVGWGVENYGTDPDYDVDITPQDWAAGRDPQLDKAIDLVTRALKKWKAEAPDVQVRPNLSLPVLPPRATP